MVIRKDQDGPPLARDQHLDALRRVYAALTEG